MKYRVMLTEVEEWCRTYEVEAQSEKDALTEVLNTDVQPIQQNLEDYTIVSGNTKIEDVE